MNHVALALDALELFGTLPGGTIDVDATLKAFSMGIVLMLCCPEDWSGQGIYSKCH